MILRDESHITSLARDFAAARDASTTAGPTLGERRAHLLSIERLVGEYGGQIARAIAADFGHRSYHETQLTELFPTRQAARYARRHLARWMAPQRADVAPYLWPAKARVVCQPVGVAGIIAAWNYPLLLAFGPLIAALAAGNRVMIKMSELSPHTAALLARIIATRFARDHVSIVSGGEQLGKAFAGLPFNHLLFTGSTETGRSVMRQAATNLTPVTLELGGKSPAIIGCGADIANAAARIMAAKCCNAGQTCIAPDYVLLPAGQSEAFIGAARRSIAKRYPSLANNPDYTRIVSAGHLARLRDLLEDATAKGAIVVPLFPPDVTADLPAGMLAPVIVTNVRDDMRIMREEIFGPLLPLRTYAELDDSVTYVNSRPRPLALYFFSQRAADIATVLRTTLSGGVCINDAMLQFAVDSLPFGGTGASGSGAYHGRAGFETFSHKRAIFSQASPNGVSLLDPPYGRRFTTILRFLWRAGGV